TGLDLFAVVTGGHDRGSPAFPGGVPDFDKRLQTRLGHRPDLGGAVRLFVALSRDVSTLPDPGGEDEFPVPVEEPRQFPATDLFPEPRGCPALVPDVDPLRSEERRVGKACRSRWERWRERHRADATGG